MVEATIRLSKEQLLSLLFEETADGPYGFVTRIQPARAKAVQLTKVQELPDGEVLVTFLTDRPVADAAVRLTTVSVPRLLSDLHGPERSMDGYTHEAAARKALTTFAGDASYHTRETHASGEVTIDRALLFRTQKQIRAVLDALLLTENVLADALQDSTAFTMGRAVAREEMLQVVREWKAQAAQKDKQTALALLRGLAELVKNAPAEAIPRPFQQQTEYIRRLEAYARQLRASLQHVQRLREIAARSGVPLPSDLEPAESEEV